MMPDVPALPEPDPFDPLIADSLEDAVMVESYHEERTIAIGRDDQLEYIVADNGVPLEAVR